MANQPEVTSYDAGVYQLEITDPVDGGVGAVSNAPLLALANRTNYLKKHMDDLESGTTIPAGIARIASPALTGSPTAPTQAAGDNTDKLATDKFVQTAVNGIVVVDISGNATTTLTQAQWGTAIIILTGAVTANKAVVFPAQSGHWQVVNSTTGNFTVTLKTAAGSGTDITRGRSSNIYCDGNGVSLQQTDFLNAALTGVSTAPTVPFNTENTQIANMVALGLAKQGWRGVGIGYTASTVLGADAVGRWHRPSVGGITLTLPPMGSVDVGSSLNIHNGSPGILTIKTSGTDKMAIPGDGLSMTLVPNEWVSFTYNTDAIYLPGGRGKLTEVATIDSPALTGSPTAPDLARFAVGDFLVNADTLKAAGIQAGNFRSIPLSVATVTLTAADAGTIVAITGSGGGTLNLPAASSVPAGASIAVVAMNTDVSTNSLKASGGDTIYGYAGESSYLDTSTAVMRGGGDAVLLMSNGVDKWVAISNNLVLSRVMSQAQKAFSPIVGGTRNARMSLTAASASATYTADEVVLETALGGQAYRLASFSKTINLSTTGAGGMDTGVAPSNGYVAVYAIYNPTTGVSALLATNATSAVVPEVYGGANMPAGYSTSALVSVWPTTSGRLFQIGFQEEREVSIPYVSAATTTSQITGLTALSIASVVPPNTKSIFGWMACAGANTTNLSISIASGPSGLGYQQVAGNSTSTTISNITTGSYSGLKLITQQVLYWSAGAASGTFTSATLNISGYRF